MQEKYQELKKKLEEINNAIVEAEKFAAASGLQMGQSRYSPGRFECVNPETGWPDGNEWRDSTQTFEDYEHWIGSEVCW